MGDHDPYAEHFDAGHSGKDHTVHQRLRANSSIMELKKILVANRGYVVLGAASLHPPGIRDLDEHLNRMAR